MSSRASSRAYRPLNELQGPDRTRPLLPGLCREPMVAQLATACYSRGATLHAPFARQVRNEPDNTPQCTSH
jgi:hypothetical protein